MAPKKVSAGAKSRYDSFDAVISDLNPYKDSDGDITVSGFDLGIDDPDYGDPFSERDGYLVWHYGGRQYVVRRALRIPVSYKDKKNDFLIVGYEGAGGSGMIYGRARTSAARAVKKASPRAVSDSFDDLINENSPYYDQDIRLDPNGDISIDDPTPPEPFQYSPDYDPNQPLPKVGYLVWYYRGRLVLVRRALRIPVIVGIKADSVLIGYEGAGGSGMIAKRRGV